MPAMSSVDTHDTFCTLLLRTPESLALTSLARKLNHWFSDSGTQVPTTDRAESMCSRLQVRDHCSIHWFHTILIHPPPQRNTMAVLDCSISVAPSNTSMQRCANWQRTLKRVAFQELNVHWCHYHSEVLGQSPQIERTGCLSAAAQLCDLSPCANKPSHPKIQNWTPAKMRDAKFQKFHLHPLHFNTFKVPAVTSLVVSHTYRRINRPPSHKSSTRKARTVYLSGIPTQATSWPKHMITKTPQETATVCLNTCHDLTYCSYIFVPLCWSRTNFTIPPAWKSKVQFHQRSSRDVHLASSSFSLDFACLATARTWREQDLQKGITRLSINPWINQQMWLESAKGCPLCPSHPAKASSIFVEVLGRRRKRRPPSSSNGSCHLAQMSNVIGANDKATHATSFWWEQVTHSIQVPKGFYIAIKMQANGCPKRSWRSWTIRHCWCTCRWEDMSNRIGVMERVGMKNSEE